MLTASFHLHNDTKPTPHAFTDGRGVQVRWVDLDGLSIFGDQDNLLRLAFALVAAAHMSGEMVAGDTEPAEPTPVEELI